MGALVLQLMEGVLARRAGRAPHHGRGGIVDGLAVAIDAFGWLQTKGICAVLVQGTHVIGDFVVPSATVDGATMPSAAFETDGPYVGVVANLEADGEMGLVNLAID